MWTAGFVLLTLIVNAPLLPWVLRVTGLSKGEGSTFAGHKHQSGAHCRSVNSLGCIIAVERNLDGLQM